MHHYIYIVIVPPTRLGMPGNRACFYIALSPKCIQPVISVCKVPVIKKTIPVGKIQPKYSNGKNTLLLDKHASAI